MNRGIVVIGGGGHAKVIVSTLIDLDIRIKAIYDDDPAKWGKDICGSKIVGPISELNNSPTEKAIMAIGNNKTRSTLVSRFKRFHWMSLVHPHSYVQNSVSIGEGTVIFAGTVIQSDVVIGKHCIINSGSTVDHDCVIGDYAHIGPGSSLAGGVLVMEGAFLGIGIAAIVGKSVGKWSVVGAGGVITEDIPDYVIALGVPAKVVKYHDVR